MSGTSNGQIMDRVNQLAAERDIPLVVSRLRMDSKSLPGGAVRSVAIFLISMPDGVDGSGRKTVECTGHGLRWLWAGMQLVTEGRASWLPWDRSAADEVQAS